MPTTRLMQFSTPGRSEETINEDGARTTRTLLGVSSAHFLRLIEERGQLGFWTLEFSTNHMTISVGLYRLLGINPSMPFNWPDLEAIIHPDDHPVHAHMDQAMRSGHVIDREFKIVRPDGTMRWLQNKAEVIVDTNGSVARAIGVMIDISDQHAARRSVEDGWYRYKALVSSMAVTEYGLQPDGDFVYSTGWHELTGQTKDEASGMGCLNAIHPDDRDLVKSNWISSLTNGSLYAFDPRIRDKEGRYRRFLSRATPVRNSDGTIREWFGALIEVADKGVTVVDENQTTAPLKASHLRAARALLDWTVEELAVEAGVSVSSIRRIETDAGHTVRVHIRQLIRQTLERNGISFQAGPNASDISLGYTALQTP